MSNLTESKQNYQEKIKAQFERLSERIEDLKAKGADIKADAEIEYNANMAELYVKREEVEIKLRELQNSSDEAWTEMQKGLEQAWNELSHSWNQALAKF
jgi:hypothetical protein